ncbi:MAG: MMPL family transporter [Acidobacteriota bacterium]
MSRPARIARVIYRWRLAISAFVVAGALALAPLVDFTRLDNDLSAWISPDDPVYQTYERFRDEFGGTRTLIVAIRAAGIFTPEGLAFIDEVTRDIEGVPLVERVHSLATANVVRPLPATEDDDGGIEVTPLLERRTDTQAEAEAVRADALADPLMRGDLVSADGNVTALIVSFDEDRIEQVRGQTIDRIQSLVRARLPPGFEAYVNGSLEISETYDRVTRANVETLLLPILLLTAFSLYVMFRSVRTTVLILAAVGVSVVWTLGIYTLLGLSFNVLTSMLTPLVVVLAVADDVHIVQHFDHERRAGASAEEAFVSSVRNLFAPLLGASGTTALGMLSLATSDVVAVKTFGIGAAIGVMIDFALSITLVPTMLTFVDPKPQPPPQEAWLLRPLQRVGRFSFGHAPLVLAAAAFVVAASFAGMSRLRVDTNHINFFAPTHPLSQSAAIMDRELAGIYSFNILLEGPPDTLQTPDALGRIERLSRQLEALPYVRKVTSVADYVKRVNQQLRDGDPAAYVVPADADLIAQELFVFGLSDLGRAELARVAASDYSRAHIAVKLASMSSDLVFAQIEEADRLAAIAFAGSPITPTVTGSGRIFAALDHYLVTSQLSSFGTAFVTVFGVIFIVFRSWRFGLLGIAANVFPVIVVLGLMGWMDISLNVATVMLASITLGIVDDDTIHFIGRFRRETAAGRSTAEAVELASMHEGRAALTTTLVNALGFSVLLASEYRPSAWFGGLLAVTMALAFLAEVFLVPALIARLPRLFAAHARTPEPALTP